MPGLATPTAQANRKRRLLRAAPESVGVSSEAILAFVDAVERKVGGLHSFMLVRHGKVAAEGWWTPYAPSHPHMLYSLSKSFASTAVGFAVAEGKLTVDAPVLSFFPEEAPKSPSANLSAMRVKHLLSMATGHDKDATGALFSSGEKSWVRTFLNLPVEHAPGSKFVYNSAATYLCSAIVQKLAGMTLLDYLKPRLFDPLGIEGMTWETCPLGINTGGWGLNVKTEDIARFGQLYLQKGKWNGKQVLSEAWIAEATSKQISNGDPASSSDWSQGYGYQFWRCRHGQYRGDGAFGQYCIVMPEQDAVLAITSGVGDMQAVLNCVWEHLSPAMQKEPLPTSDAEAMQRRLAALTVSHPEGKRSSPTAQRVSGKTYRLETNAEKAQSVAFAFKGDRCVLTWRSERGEERLECGAGAWAKGTATMGDRPGQKAAASGAWAGDDTYTVKVCFYETPYIATYSCVFAGDQVTLKRKMNVSFGSTELPALIGNVV